MNQGMEAEDTIDFAERLGDPGQLAEQASAATVYPTWAGRHPWLAFVAGTPVLFLLSVAGFVLLLAGVAALLEGQTVETSPALMQAFVWASWTIAFQVTLPYLNAASRNLTTLGTSTTCPSGWTANSAASLRPSTA